MSSSALGTFPNTDTDLNCVGIRVRKKGSFGKGSFQKSPFSRDSREFRELREPSDLWKRKEIPTCSRDSREFRDFRDLSNEKTPFLMTLFPSRGIFVRIHC